MNHQQLNRRFRFSATLLACTAGFSLGAGPAAVSGGGAASSGGHAASPAPAAAAPAQSAAPSAPTQAAPGANPTTPAGNRSTPGAEIHRQQTPEQSPAAATNNGSSHEHHRREQNQNPQYQSPYGNFWYPEVGFNGQYGNTNVPNTAANTNYSTNNDANQQSITPATPPVTNNSTSVAAQAANAVTHSPEMVSVNQEAQQAQAAYQADRQRVIAALADKPEYKQALAKQDEARKDMKDVKPLGAGTPGTPSPAVMDAAASKLDASDEVTKMQEAAIAADPQAVADKDKMVKLAGERDAQDARLRSQH